MHMAMGHRGQRSMIRLGGARWDMGTVGAIKKQGIGESRQCPGKTRAHSKCIWKTTERVEFVWSTAAAEHGEGVGAGYMHGKNMKARQRHGVA